MKNGLQEEQRKPLSRYYEMVSGGSEWEISARSEMGYVREQNEDCMTAVCLPWGQVFIVADGMGGHKGGALAADLTKQRLLQHLCRTLPKMPVTKAIRYAFEKTNKVVYKIAHSGDPDIEGMGATAVLLLTFGSSAFVAHVGDSRAYLYRRGRLHPLTKDHSVVQRMIDAGMLSPTEARDHPDAGVIYRVIGNKPNVEVDISPDLQLKPGDGVLLCSDGLCGYVDDEEIRAVLRSKVPVKDLADRLVELALKAGGEDNITVQFIQFGERTEPWGLPKRIFYMINSALFNRNTGTLPDETS